MRVLSNKDLNCTKEPIKGIMKEAVLNLRKCNSNSDMLLYKIAEVEFEPHTTAAHVARPKPEPLSEEEESYSKSCTGLLYILRE